MTSQPNTPLSPSLDADVTDDDLLVGELTAAMFESQRTDEDALPAALAERLVVTGEALVRARALPPSVATITPVATGSRSAFRTIAHWTGWLAAAALGIMVLRESPTPSPTADRVVADSARLASAPETGSPEQLRLLRATLLADAGSVQLPWTPTEDATARTVSGEVLWSPRLQQGVMRIVGLTPNDRRRWSYQLWIFDKTRDQKYPVDGGVFDIAPGQTDLLVPIRARLPVGEAVLFAVTVEQPGGVVVSSRERIAMTAKL